MHDLIVRNCHTLVITDSDKAAIRRNQDILIDGRAIVAIQPTAPTTAQAHDIIEANEMLALPGLINTHAHVPMVIFRGLAEDVSIERWFNEFMWPLESNLTEEDVYYGQVIMRDRQFLTVDKTEVIRQVNRSMERLAQRVSNKRIQVYNP